MSQTSSTKSKKINFFSKLGFRRDDVSTSSVIYSTDKAYQFDPVFYKKHHGDLINLQDNDALLQHYLEYGKQEGRPGTSNELLLRMKAKHGELPVDFNASNYRILNKDLYNLILTWEIEYHYLVYGQYENRQYSSHLDIKEFDENNLESSILSTNTSNSASDILPSEGGGQVRISTKKNLALSHSPWKSKFVFNEFVLLNSDWLGRSALNRQGTIEAFVEEGIDQIAPISIENRFDPSFYRHIAGPALRSATDADLYREWLSAGVERAEPPNEGKFLSGLIGEDTFPDCFQVQVYLKQIDPDLAQRWKEESARSFLLEHYINYGFENGNVSSIKGQNSDRLLAQMANFYLIRGRVELSKRACDLSLNIRSGVASVHHTRGDALLCLGQEPAALEDFLFAANHPGGNLWSHIHAVNGLINIRKDVESALQQITKSSEFYGQNSEWRNAAFNAVKRCFSLNGENAKQILAFGNRDAAYQTINEFLAQMILVIRQIFPPPSALPQTAEGPIVLIANRDLVQCDHYRVTQKCQQLEEAGFEVEVFNQHDLDHVVDALNKASAVIFYRVAAFPDVVRAQVYASGIGLKTYYDIDDLIFDERYYPDTFESFEGQITHDDYVDLQYGVPLFAYAMSLCDIGFASTDALREFVATRVRYKICHVVRNGLDARNAAFMNYYPTSMDPNKVTIFYGSGTKAHNKDFNDLVSDALLKILIQYPQTRLLIAGYLKLNDGFDGVADQVTQLGFTADVKSYWEVLSGVDINLAALHASAAADCKSEIKWLEAAVSGVPSVVSPTATYEAVLVDGVDAVFARNPEEWYDALNSLVADAERRRAIGDQARQKALSAYSLEVGAEIYRKALQKNVPHSTDVSPMGQKISVRKTRLMIVNVFFPPQTYGGATRVVKDNVDDFIDHHGDDFELCAVCADEGVQDPYRLRIDTYRNIPVFRMSTPAEVDMDWRPHNPKTAQIFAEIVKRMRPDLIHFHCVQRLTGSVVEVALQRKIPYVVTAHDAWWISDHQFLVDDDGVIELPTSDTGKFPAKKDRDPIVSIARRRMLARLLAGARAVLPVSDSFTEIYRNAGLANVNSIPNGLPEMTFLPRTSNSGRTVRLGHFGNRSAHKGAKLIEHILRTNQFPNLTLTMIDYAYSAGYRKVETWGATPVELIGPVKQENINLVYARLDVLLAPSLWPESFGLVTREAKAAGLWVVASDRGAIGEDIIQGVDGYRVDVSTPEALTQLLSDINGSPSRYQNSPPSNPVKSRSAADQARDLIALYRELLP